MQRRWLARAWAWGRSRWQALRLAWQVGGCDELRQRAVARALSGDCFSVQVCGTHQALTGLPSRRLFNDRLALALAHARRSGERVAMVHLDLDRFRMINDGLGWSTGDAVLREVARRLVACVHESDTVAHFGGDEFAVLIDDMRRSEDVIAIVRDLQERLAEPMPIAGQVLHVESSIGVSIFPKDGDTPEALARNAAAALQRAKDKGRHRVVFYREDMNARSRERLHLERALRQALVAGELELHFQPQVELASCSMVGVEALVRWRKPGGELVPPGEFIPLAEETGLIIPLGDWVLAEACRQGRRWLDCGYPPVTVAVNLSARQFAQPELVATVRRVLQETGLPPALLELEITETVAMQDAQGVIGTLHELKALGVLLSIDDFGTGYSSLSYLKRFPVDRLKIDRCFVHDIGLDRDGERIALAIIGLAHSLGLDVIAEGVERPEQRDVLQAHGCDQAQGYLFARPLPVTELEAMMCPLHAQLAEVPA